jgi:hypothetical protein
MATKADAALADILAELVAIEAATAGRSADMQQSRPEIPRKKSMGIGNVEDLPPLRIAVEAIRASRQA